MKSIKLEQVTEEISRALDQMNKEIVHSSPPVRPRPGKPWWVMTKEKETPAQRREAHIVKGTASFFTGIALMIFLYYFTSTLVLKIPPEWIAQIPFELEPVVRIAWLIGLIPTLSGLGRITAGLLISPTPARAIDAETQSRSTIATDSAPQVLPESITEHTTELLDQKAPLRQTNEMKG